MPVNANGKNTSTRPWRHGNSPSDTGWLFWSFSVKSGATSPTAASAHRCLVIALAFGCTSRLAIQSPRLADDVCISPAVGADSAISAGCTCPGLPVLGVATQIDAFLGERGDGVHQRVDEIAVAVAPPQQHHVNHFVGVFVEQVTAALVLDIESNVVVAVLVPAQFLHNLIFLDAQ